MNRYLMAPSGGLATASHLHPQPLGAQFFPNWASRPARGSSPTTRRPSPNRGLAMPKRKRTRVQDRAYRIEHQRALNHARHAADPPPFYVRR